MSTSQNNRDLVPQEALNQLKALEGQLDSTKKNMEALLVPVAKLSDDLSKASKNYKDLVDAMNRYNQISNQVNRTVNQGRNTQNQMLQLQERINNAYSEEALELERLRQTMQQINRTRRNLVQEQNSQSGSLNQLRAQLNQVTQSYDAMSRSTRNSPIGQQVFNDIRRLTDEVSRLEQATGRSQRNVGNYLNRIGTAIGVFAGNMLTKGISLFTSAISNATSTIINFEKANSILASVLGINKKEVKEMSNAAIELGKTSKYTASQVTELQTELAKLGFSKGEILTAQKDILNFATALNANLADAAELAGATIRAFGADTQDTQQYVAAMTIAANKTALSFEYLATAMPIVAPVAKAFNFTIEDTLALLGQLSNSGFDASSAATSLRNILLNLADSNGKLAKALGKPVTSAEELAEGLKTLRDRGIDLATALELTDKRSVAAFQTFLQGADDLIPLKKELQNVGDQLQKLADEQANNVAGAIDTLNSAWEGLMLSFSNSTGPMKKVIDSLTWIVNKLNEAIASIGGITGSSEYKSLLNENYKSSYEREKVRINEKVEEGYSLDLIFTIKTAESEKRIKEAIEGLDKYNEGIQKNINAGIQKKITKEQQTMINVMEFDIASYKEHLKAVQDLQKEMTSNNSQSTTSVSTTPKKDKSAQKEAEKAAKARKKLLEDELKAESTMYENQGKRVSEKLKEIVSDTEKSYKERSMALTDFVSSQKDLIENQKETEIEALKKKYKETFKTEAGWKEANAKSIKMIEDKAAGELEKIDREAGKTRLELAKSYANKQVKEVQKGAEESAGAITKIESEALKDLAVMYKEGQITSKEYEDGKIDIAKKSAKDRFDVEFEMLQNSLDVANLTKEQRESLEKKLLDTQLQYTKHINDLIIKEDYNTAKKREEIQKKLAEASKKLAGEAVNFITALYESNTEKELKRVEAEQESLQESTDKRIEEVDRLEEAGAISAEQADARKALIAQQQKQREDELAAQKAEINKRQVEFEKKLSIVQILVNTASAIMKNNAQLGWIPAIPINALTVATGAAQVATVMAQSVPEYAKGTSDHKGGLAVVGDGKRHELALFPDGTAWKTPASDTLVNLPKHTQVFPDFNKAMAFTDLNIGKEVNNIITPENKRQIELAEANNKLMKGIRSDLAGVSKRDKYSDAFIRIDNRYKKSN